MRWDSVLWLTISWHCKSHFSPLGPSFSNEGVSLRFVIFRPSSEQLWVPQVVLLVLPSERRLSEVSTFWGNPWKVFGSSQNESLKTQRQLAMSAWCLMGHVLSEMLAQSSMYTASASWPFRWKKRVKMTGTHPFSQNGFLDKMDKYS